MFLQSESIIMNRNGESLTQVSDIPDFESEEYFGSFIAGGLIDEGNYNGDKDLAYHLQMAALLFRIEAELRLGFLPVDSIGETTPLDDFVFELVSSIGDIDSLHLLLSKLRNF